MILKALTLENFKGIREPVRIEFAPLTLLFGPNNAGKSTVVQALMYARHVLEGHDCDARRTALGGDVVDLGGFRNLVHGHDPDRAIRMRFELVRRETALPSFMSDDKWADLQHREEHALGVDDELSDAFGLPDRFDWAKDQLKDIWIELEIAHRKSHAPQHALNPVVRRYSVGTGSTLYATISLPEDSERAALTYFDFGAPPFGWRYSKGDASDFEWDFARVARHWLEGRVFSMDNPSRGLKKGARVAFAGESSDLDTNMMSREHFDTVVAQILAGDGRWGDESVSPGTGEYTWHYQVRQDLLRLAQEAQEIRDKYRRARELDQRALDCLLELEQEFARIQDLDTGLDGLHGSRSSDPEEADGVDGTDAPSPEELHRLSRLWHQLTRSESNETDELAGCWLLQWVLELTNLFDGSVTESIRSSAKPGYGYNWIANMKWRAEDAIELTVRNTALPDWRQMLQPFTNIWAAKREAYHGPWRPIAEDYLIDFLSSVIVGPGKLLLDALQSSTYLGPFRKLPSRDYRPTKGGDPSSWAAGLAAWDLLSQDEHHSLLQALNCWLTADERFNTGYRVVVQRRKKLEVNGTLWETLLRGDLAAHGDFIRQELQKLPEESKVEFENSSSGVVLAAQDLGVGISQAVPVITAVLHNTAGILAVEEPEANIHPRFQVVLGDLFITQANANQGTMFLVETHSEHLVLRIMRRMRETYHGKQVGTLAVTPADVSILYVEREGDRTIVRSMPLNEAGELVKAWPGGFFEEGLKEQFGDD